MEQIGFYNPVEVKKAKELVKHVYADLGIKKKAKATDLDELFYTKKTIKKSVRYVELVKARLVE